MGMFSWLCFTCCTWSSQIKIMIPSVNNTLHLESRFHPGSSKPSTNMTSFILPALPGRGHSSVSQPGKKTPYPRSSPTRVSEAKVLTEHFHLSRPQVRGRTRLLSLSLPRVALRTHKWSPSGLGGGVALSSMPFSGARSCDQGTCQW